MAIMNEAGARGGALQLVNEAGARGGAVPLMNEAGVRGGVLQSMNEAGSRRRALQSMNEAGARGGAQAGAGTDFRDLTEIRIAFGKPGQRPSASAWVRHQIMSSVPPDKEVAVIVQKYMELLGTKLEQARHPLLTRS